MPLPVCPPGEQRPVSTGVLGTSARHRTARMRPLPAQIQGHWRRGLVLINRRKVKEFALEMGKHRAHKFTRVGSKFFIKCEVNLKTFIRNQVHSLLSLAKISSGAKTLGFCGISRNPRRHDSLADPRASPSRCGAEIPPEIAPGDAGLATPTARAEPLFQATTPHAAGPGPLGFAFASLGRMEKSAVLGSTQHRPSVASRRLSALLAMEKLCSQFRPENRRPKHHPPNRPNESRQSAPGCSSHPR